LKIKYYIAAYEYKQIKIGQMTVVATSFFSSHFLPSAVVKYRVSKCSFENQKIPDQNWIKTSS
jgi:hypothetical protein